MAKVQVQLCYMWTCPCGHKNYAEGLEMTPEELAESLEDAGIAVPDDTAAIALPEFVVCRRCFDKHETESPLLSDPIDMPEDDLDK
jgi:transcription elongation factor Elf1